MSQILKSLQFPTASLTPTTPPSGFGTIYPSGSNKFYYKNPAGAEFDLTTANGYINILYYTGSAIGDGTTQTYTWQKPPAGLKYIEVCCVGAGGGGGSGAKGPVSGFGSQGGSGGGGGAITWATFDASMLSNSYPVIIGAGGAGALGITTGGPNNVYSGNTGTAGGTSSFGSLVVARGGSGGAGGSGAGTRRTAGGQALLCTPAGFPYAYNGCNGATMTNVPANPAGAAPTIFNTQINTGDLQNISVVVGNGGGGGGNGGSFQSGNVVRTSGSRGSNGYQFTTLITSNGFPGSASHGQNATAPTNNMITTLLHFTSSTTLYGLGGGGHGGASAVSPFNGGNGSNGGLYGAGGGGGGSLNYVTIPSASGNGGSGSSGLCIVVEFY